jgi:pyruvate dehydrogenase E1 component
MVDERDLDPIETREWIESMEAVVHLHGKDRALQILKRVLQAAAPLGAAPQASVTTDYVNTLSPDQDDSFPGDLAMEERIENIIRWNAAVMVAKANKTYDGLGGHISTFASSATLYEVGFQHFFRGKDGEHSGDQIFYQGHSSPGMYARSFLEGRFTKDDLLKFRRESARLSGGGLSSYPHPRLMPNYWEFPTVSMGLGPMAAVYQARFNRYLDARGLGATGNSRVWAFLGDGETDEPESSASLTLAAREGLDNLTFVINCNLQRLDGPVRGNGKIVQELEGLYRGAGWNVIKLLWGREWDALLAADRKALIAEWNAIPDGEWQHFADGNPALLRSRFFGRTQALEALAANLSDEDLARLKPGGHDRRRVYAAFKEATAHRGAPTVILAQTVKGFKLGSSFAGKNSTHQMKKISSDQLRELRDLLNIPLKDDGLLDFPFFHPGKDSAEVRYVKERRAALNGVLPSRKVALRIEAKPPAADLFQPFLKGSKSEASTTMVLAQVVSRLLKDKEIGSLIVPIIPDEARTFGMDPLFQQAGIYTSKGQTYEPVDRGTLLYYREAKDGQVMQEGINEAGSMASFTAAGTSYATHGVPTLPIYTFYSMFGFQRIGDQAWAFGDARGRGFLMGGTSGRTTLNGEGLQHEDGHSHILCSTIPNLKAYDPAFAFELAVLMQDGIDRMMVKGEDVFYYITVHNENYAQPAMPSGVEEGIRKGLYRFLRSDHKSDLRVHLFGSGAIMNQVLLAQTILHEKYDVAADVWSATSYKELREEALRAERRIRELPQAPVQKSYLEETLETIDGPIIAASDYVKLFPEMIARFVKQTFVPLGTDGFGMSDTREALREHFEVDAKSIVYGALFGLFQEGRIDRATLAKARVALGKDKERIDPLDV